MKRKLFLVGIVAVVFLILIAGCGETNTAPADDSVQMGSSGLYAAIESWDTAVNGSDTRYTAVLRGTIAEKGSAVIKEIEDISYVYTPYHLKVTGILKPSRNGEQTGETLTIWALGGTAEVDGQRIAHSADFSRALSGLQGVDAVFILKVNDGPVFFDGYGLEHPGATWTVKDGLVTGGVDAIRLEHVPYSQLVQDVRQAAR